MSRHTPTLATEAAVSSFWKWFVANEPKLFSIENSHDVAFTELAREMNSVCKDLTFELGSEQHGRRDFVISAGGSRSAFPAVELLHSRAPKLPRWAWVKFRPRRQTLSTLTVDGRTIAPDHVRYLLARDEDENRVGIALFIDGYVQSEDNAFEQAGYLLLDEALGEFAVETKVGFIDFHSTESEYFPRSRPISELAGHFDEHWADKTP